MITMTSTGMNLGDRWKPLTQMRHVPSQTLTDRILELVYGNQYQFLSEDSLIRIQEANQFYGFYNLDGQYWEPSVHDYDPTILPVNLCKYFVKKRTSWMTSVAPDLECPVPNIDDPDAMKELDYQASEAQNKAARDAVGREEILRKIWDENRLVEKLLGGCNDFFIGGTVGLRIRYIPERGIRYSFHPTQEIFPVPDEEEPEKPKTIHLCSFLDNERTIWKQTWEMKDGMCYLSEGKYDLRNLSLKEKRYDGEPTGLDFLPFVIIPHCAFSEDMFGTSYVRDLIPIWEQYSRSMSDAADALRFNMFAVNVFLNAGPSAKKLRIAPNAVIGLEGDDVDAKKLESGFNYSNALNDFLTRLDNLMHLLGNIPDVTPERVKGFGLVSGVALKLLYAELVDATQESWRVWKSRLQDVNEYTLKMLDVYGNTEGFPYDFDLSVIDDSFENRIIPHLPLPENEAEKISMEVNRMANSLQSVEGALTELGEKNPKQKIAEIVAERMMFLDQGLGGYRSELASGVDDGNQEAEGRNQEPEESRRDES